MFVLRTVLYSFPKSTTLLRKKDERIHIQDSYLRLGNKRAEAFIGWYAFKAYHLMGLAFMVTWGIVASLGPLIDLLPKS